MLGTRTKQVFSYGRRGHRIVNVSENRESGISATGSSKAESNTPSIFSDAPSPQPILQRRKRAVIVTPPSSPESVYQPSPTPPPKKAKKKSPKNAKLSKAKAAAAFRHPLGTFPANVPGSPAIPSKFTQHRLGKVIPANVGGSPVKRKTPKKLPTIDVDIVVLDTEGRPLSHEKRVSRPDVQVNKLPALSLEPNRSRRNTVQPAAKSAPPVIILDDSEEDIPLNGTANKARTIVISSDDSDSDIEIKSKPVPQKLVIPSRSHPKKSSASSTQEQHKRAPLVVINRPPVPAAPAQAPPAKVPAVNLPSAPSFVCWTPGQKKSKPYVLVPPPRINTRPLTPARYRNGRPSIFPAPPSPPSPTTPTDGDLSLDFSQLDITDNVLNDRNAYPQPEYLQPLLEECSQTTPHEFSAFIEMFPFDPIVQTAGGNKSQFQKIGEASYSEVFGIGDVVLKVIPLRDETCGDALPSDDVDTPAPSDAKDVLKEIIVTHAMGEMCDGFVKLLRTYIVRGKYPSLLLNLWDKYNEEKGSEGVRPDTFTLSQVYAIIVLPNGGPDLEAFTFPSPTKSGWKQACSLFWQVTRTLADAEDLVCFEHRDLHWGQILVKALPTVTKAGRSPVGPKVSMDDERHGILATVIDLGLARMNSEDDAEGVRWTPFDEEIFDGEGEYQFDVYRMMRMHNGNCWEGYRPLTNVMWLHYLTLKLLNSKRLKPPGRKTAASSAVFTEWECYECLMEMEEVLGSAVASCKAPPPGRKGRRKTHAPVKAQNSAGPKSAGDVVELAMAKGWVR